LDIDHLLGFLRTLEPESETCEFYWSGQHADGRRIQTYGTLEAMLPRLVHRNEEGFGIFVCLNRLTKVIDDHGVARRKASQVTRIRACFADWDNASKKPPWPMPLEPTMITETSKHRYHFYWCVDDFPLEHYEQAQRGIAAALGSDASVIDLSREVRVAGFDHTKGTPTPVKLIECSGKRYGPDEILGAFPAKPREKRPAINEGTVRTKAAMTAAILNHFHPMREDGGYNIRCPWESEHTTPSNATSSVYYPPGERGPDGYYKCLHAHCQDRTAADLDNWFATRLFPVI
jgi:hypothetical protein